MKGFMSKKRSGGKIGSYTKAAGKKGTQSKDPSGMKALLTDVQKDKMVQPSKIATKSR